MKPKTEVSVFLVLIVMAAWSAYVFVSADPQPPPDPPPPPLQPGVGACTNDPQIPGCADQYACSESMLVIDRASCEACVYNRISYDAYYNGSPANPQQWQSAASSDAASCQQKFPDLQGN